MFNLKLPLDHWVYRFIMFVNGWTFFNVHRYCRVPDPQGKYAWGKEPMDGCKVVRLLLRSAFVLAVMLAGNFLLPGIAVASLFYAFLITLATGGFPLPVMLEAATGYPFSWGSLYICILSVVFTAICVACVVGFWRYVCEGIDHYRRRRAMRHEYSPPLHPFLHAAYRSWRDKVCFQIDYPQEPK